MFIHADELRHHHEDIKWLLFPFLQRKGTMFIAAPPKSKKTYMTLGLAMAASTGHDWLGWPAERSRGLYIDQEIGVSMVKERYEKMRTALQLDGVDMAFWTRDKFRLSFDRDTKGNRELEAIIADFQPDYVVFDPLRKMTTADENSSTEMTKAFAELTRLQETHNFASILIHHTSKPSENRTAGTPDAMRGSGEIFAHGDTYGMMLGADNKDGNAMDVHWTFRNHAPIDPFKLAFDESRGMFIRRHDKPKPAKTSARPKLRIVQPGDLSDGLIQAD